VHVGGPDLCEGIDLDPGCNANFSLEVIEFADGSVSGQYSDRIGHGLDGFHAVIDCLSVDGNDAWVSGVITQGNIGDFDLAGLDVATRVRDNGVSANDPADQISLSWIGLSAFSCTDQPLGAPLFDMPQGQVIVK
jgi:hypothetical protein